MHLGWAMLAAAGGFVTYFAFGSLVFVSLPRLRDDYAKHPAVYRDHDDINKFMPIGMAAMFVSMCVLALLYAMSYRDGFGVLAGARFGALIGLFVVCAFVLHNHVNLKIGWALTWKQAVAYFVEWTLACLVIGWIYK
ncbi:MAG TPA: hypothetical protein VGN16_08795 [Acidobacteriaceae bacterium]